MPGSAGLRSPTNKAMAKTSQKRFFAFGGNAKASGQSDSRMRGHNNVKPSDECDQENRQAEINNYREEYVDKRDDDRNPIFRIREVEDADKKFEDNECDEALALYLNALPIAKERLPAGDPTVGDINIKICTLLQGMEEYSAAMNHLTKAKDIFIALHGEVNDDASKSLLMQKMIDVSVEIGDAHLSMEEMNKASESYADATLLCRTHFPDDDIQLLHLLNKSAVYLSICMNRHSEAMNLLKEALSISIKRGGGKMTIQSAHTLNNMGRIYIQRLDTNQSQDVNQDVKQGDACFTRAIQLYRISKKDQVTETLCNLIRVRAYHSESPNGILKNVRFDPQILDRLDHHNEDVSECNDLYSASCESSIETNESERNKSGFGFLTCGIENCGNVF